MKVLVADPQATVREGAVRALESAGHQVCAVADGLEAWKQARQQGFDAAFLAWHLPALDGLDLVSLWQHEPAWREKPIVMLVEAAHMPQVRLWTQLTAGQAPEWDVLTKPFSPPLMLDVLQAVGA